MRKILLVTFLSAAGTVGADDQCNKPVEWILDRYVEARGGYDGLEAQNALRIVSTNHEGKWNPKFDYRVMKPGYMWIEAVYDDGEIIYEGFDGERGWEKWGEKSATYVSGKAGQALNQGAQSPVHLYGLHHMEGLGAKIEPQGCSEIGGQYFYVINVTSKFGTDIDYYLNQESFVLERSRTVRSLHPTIDPTPITIEERWSDFRWVEGVLHPFAFSLVNVDNGELLSWLEVHTIARETRLTSEFFRMPE